jgi:maltose 6'-phosphate phosphatase
MVQKYPSSLKMPKAWIALICFLVVVPIACCAIGFAADEATSATIRVAAYNVEFGSRGTPEQIGQMFQKYKLDVIGFSEAPAGDWTARVGKTLGMEYVFVGSVSSSGHKDKYKSLLSRMPLKDTREIRLRGIGWNPATAVRAVITVAGKDVAVYSLHICHRDVKKDENGRVPTHSQSLADFIRTEEKSPYVIAMGDYNSQIGQPALEVLEDVGMRATWRDLSLDLGNLRTGDNFEPSDNWGVIDHIFYNRSSGLKTVDGGIIELEKPLSDHKPIWAELSFPEK